MPGYDLPPLQCGECLDLTYDLDKGGLCPRCRPAANAAGSRQTCHPLSPSEPPHQGPLDCPPDGLQESPSGSSPEGEVGTLLETQESSVSGGLIEQFLNASPEPSMTSPPPDLTPCTAGEKFRHAGWQPIRQRIYKSLLRTGQSSSRISSFASCGRATYIQVAADDPSLFRLQASCCHDRLCTPCANARSARIRDALLAQIGKTKPLFITLTLCGHGESLCDLIDRLYKHFRALRLHPTWADAIDGGAAFLEIKWSDKAKRWHPHLHIIADGRYVPHADLSNAWRTISKDSYIVDVRRVGNAAHAGSYVAKYASKPLNSSYSNDPIRLDEAVGALKGRRLCLCFGSWYGTPLQQAEEEDVLDEVLGEKKWVNVCSLDDYLAGLACVDCIPESARIRLGISNIRAIVNSIGDTS